MTRLDDPSWSHPKVGRFVTISDVMTHPGQATTFRIERVFNDGWVWLKDVGSTNRLVRNLSTLTDRPNP